MQLLIYIILISILFHSLSLISMKCSMSIIRYLLVKYYKFDEHKEIPNFVKCYKFHFLCYYFDILEDFKNKLIFAKKSEIELYQKILSILEVKNLVLKSNILLHKKEEENKMKKGRNNFFGNNLGKLKVDSSLQFFNELNIKKDIFVLIEFFYDFIKYENIEQLIIDNSLNGEYSVLIELKEILEQNELNKKNFTINDLSTRKYNKNKLERIFNRFYFENSKIKIVKNRNFYNENFIKKNKYFDRIKMKLLLYRLNLDDEYKPKDQINIKNYFVINKYQPNLSKPFGKIDKLWTEDTKYKTIMSKKDNNYLELPSDNSDDSSKIKSRYIYSKTSYNNFFPKKKREKIQFNLKSINPENSNNIYSSKAKKTQFLKKFKTFGQKANNILINKRYNETIEKEEKEENNKINCIKSCDSNLYNIKIHRFFGKYKIDKPKQKNETKCSQNLIIEKYNQKVHSNILRTIMDNKKQEYEGKLVSKKLSLKMFK